jgi:hypothetical protein
MSKENNMFKAGTEKDGTSNENYCRYCYQNGEFTQKKGSNCLPFLLHSLFLKIQYFRFTFQSARPLFCF